MPLESTFLFPVHHIQNTVKLTCPPDHARAFFRDPRGFFDAIDNVSYVHDTHDTRIWRITEKVPKMFGVLPMPAIRFGCNYEDTDNGAYVHASVQLGVRVEHRWSVGPREDGDDKEVTCVLREVAAVRSFIIFAPYVSSTFEETHAKLAGRLKETLNCSSK